MPSLIEIGAKFNCENAINMHDDCVFTVAWQSYFQIYNTKKNISILGMFVLIISIDLYKQRMTYNLQFPSLPTIFFDQLIIFFSTNNILEKD